ncbi:MAG TPA: hypothetical protein VKU40_06095 [Thermoanaerobaculia bacterium]|nr:hypothetical protein [Thermoanaerobaculia bacterium]
MTPEFLICLECETPCYVFEWKEGEATEILCEMCGNEDPEQFLTDEDFDQLAGG